MPRSYQLASCEALATNDDSTRGVLVGAVRAVPIWEEYPHPRCFRKSGNKGVAGYGTWSVYGGWKIGWRAGRGGADGGKGWLFLTMVT